MEDIVIEELRARAYKIALLGGIMTITSVMLWGFGRYEHKGLFKAMGGLGIVFFGISTAVALYRASKNKPLLTITTDGMIDTTCASGVGYIGFEEIASIEIVNIFGQHVIGVTPKNVNTYVNKLPKSKQRAAKMNIKMNYPPISIRLDTAKDMSIEDIYSMLLKRWNDYKSLFH